MGEEWQTDDGIWFIQGGVRSSGTGVFDPFVRLKASPTEQGYNTDYRPVQFDEYTAANYTHALALWTVPTYQLPDGILYREFKLNINEPGEGEGRFISLDEVRIYLTDDNDLHNYPTSFPTAIFDLDLPFGVPQDNFIKLDVTLGPGLGKGDMSMYVPESMFTGGFQYVTLYSKFGVNIPCTDGYEDWGVVTVIPEPTGLLALFCGFAGLSGMIVRKRR